MGLESLLIRILSWMYSAEEQYKVGLEALEGSKTGWQDAKKSARFFKYSADRGHAQALLKLGECHEYGIGIEADPVEAVRLYKISADNGCIEACVRLGDCYRTGKGVDQNANKAFKMYRTAADRNDPGGINGLGLCYEQGIGVDESQADALECYSNAAELGCAEAQYNIGRCYSQGIGLPLSHFDAIEYFKKAAAQAPEGIDTPQRKQTRPLIAEAHFAIAECYANGLGVEKDEECAEMWYRDAANLNHPEGRLKFLEIVRNQK